MTAIKGVAVRPNAVMRRMRCLFFVVFYLKGEDIMDIAETTKIVVEYLLKRWRIFLLRPRWAT